MDIQQVLKEAKKAIESCESQQQLQDVKVAYLGKKGKVTGLLKLLKDFTLEEKKSKGAEINSIKVEIEEFGQSHVVRKPKDLQQEASLIG